MLLAEEQLFHKLLIDCDCFAVLLSGMDQLFNCSIIGSQLLCLVVDELHQLGTIGNSVLILLCMVMKRHVVIKLLTYFLEDITTDWTNWIILSINRIRPSKRVFLIISVKC